MSLKATIILAAGKGTRLNNGEPSTKSKVMYEIADRPMIGYTRDLAVDLKASEIVFVVGYQHEIVEKYLGADFIYAVQEPQLGTGQALKVGLDKIKSDTGYLLVLQGDDSAFYQVSTIRNFIDEVKNKLAVCGLITCELDNPENFGRIIRDDNGFVSAIIEKIESTSEQINIKEINCGTYCFDIAWLKNNINKLQKHEPKGEYFLTDLIKIATDQKVKVVAFKLKDNSEWVGVNTPEQLKFADEKMREKIKNNIEY
jgi:bifunctional UDP-N-acetylglucosamine pyrophosphorylase/glucosamine-1-phosphate N-acetyltransferase